MNSEAVPTISFRKAGPSDWSSIRDICCKTAQAGSPIDPARWPFFGHLWVAPYEQLLPEWCFVAHRGARVIAYLTGCPNTSVFHFRRFFRFDLPLALELVLTSRFPSNADTRRTLRRFFGLDPDPERAFSRETRRLIKRDYPAHLHINAEAEVRGGGIGRKLIDLYQSELSKTGIRGIHLFCGAAPVSFYEKCGFKVLERIEFGQLKVPIFAMGRLLTAAI